MKTINGYAVFNPQTERIADFVEEKETAKIFVRYWKNKGRKHYVVAKCKITYEEKNNKARAKSAV